MKYFDWDPEKNASLTDRRNISFEDVLVAIQDGYLLEVVEHPNRKRYPNQQLFVVLIEDYVYIVPFVEDDEKIFLKTIIPSRKATKKYRKEIE